MRMKISLLEKRAVMWLKSKSFLSIERGHFLTLSAADDSSVSRPKNLCEQGDDSLMHHPL